MDDLSSLLQVRFRESWRGYDPAEVDAYVDQVSNAIARTQGELDALAGQAETSGTGSEDRSDPGAETSAADAAPAADELAQTLASTQDPAEELISEARGRAEQIIAEAESRAEATIASVRAEALKIRSEADEYVESTYANAEKLAGEREAAAATEERQKHASEISELNAQRTQLVDDLETLERHVGEQRRQIEMSLSTLTDLVKSPETFRVAPAPAAESEPAGDGPDEPATPEVEDDSAQSAAAGRDGALALDAASVFDDEVDSLPVDELLKTAGDDDFASAYSANGRQRFVTAADLEEQLLINEPSWPEQQIDDGPAVASLFDEEALPQAVATRREEEPFLAQLREAASRDNMRVDSDDALSAFFNQEEDQRRSPWFLGGR